MKKQIRAIDLFCGCGGSSQGMKDAGFEIICGIDNDPLPKETYERNIRAPYLLQTIDAEFDLPEQADFIAFSPPCQAYSNITKHRKLTKAQRLSQDAGKHAIDAILRKPPTAIFMENVKRYQNSPVFAYICRELRKADYEVAHNVVDAANFGVPQHRVRLIMLAIRKDRLKNPLRDLAEDVACQIYGEFERNPNYG